MKDPRELIVIGFGSELLAREALLAVFRLHTEGTLVVHDAVFVQKGEDGTTQVTETTDVPPGEAALGGSVWGLLLGTLLGGPLGGIVAGAATAGVSALMAQLIDTGIQDGTVDELRETVAPGVTALALLVSHIQLDGLTEELRRFAGARLVQTTLRPEAVMAVRDALRKGTSAEPPSAAPDPTDPEPAAGAPRGDDPSGGTPAGV